ncbi:laccase 4 [Agrocybe pediades]|nr:laccase 4 [Agrocybe pediades]
MIPTLSFSFHSSLIALLTAILIECASAAIGPCATLNIGNAVLAPDGFSRTAVVAEGIHPGPLITGKRGDRFDINVVNNLSNDTMLRGTSIHWHGLLQHHTAWADGVAGVTQCPIAPGNEFLYSFQTWEKAGTYWYHSHFGTQYCDGLRGALVIYDPYDPYRYLYDVDDESTVITLADWYHLPSASLPLIPQSNSTLINGKGRYVGGPKVDLAVINVQKGKKYRFRLVSLSCDPNYTFSIDGHDLTIIETDGELTRPLTVGSIQIFAAQRYSFIMHANQDVGNYWVRALPNVIANNTILAGGFNGGVNSAILRYASAPIAEPTYTQAPKPKLGLLNEGALQSFLSLPCPGQPVPGGADININLDLGFNTDDGRFTINGKTFREPSIPVLLQILSGAKAPWELLPSGDIIKLERGKVVEVTIPAGVLGGPHPFHLHGHTFSVVRSAGESTYQFDYPVRRDVVSIGGQGDNVTIRFDTINPGPWILHCHIDFHLHEGLAIVFAEAPEDVSTDVPIPESWNDLCPNYLSLTDNATSVRLVSRHKAHSKRRQKPRGW